MDWYGIEPLVPADPERVLRLAAAARIPLVRQFIGRRVAEAVSGGDKGDLTPLVAALAGSSEPVQLDLLRGVAGWLARSEKPEDAGRLARPLRPPGPEQRPGSA